MKKFSLFALLLGAGFFAAGCEAETTTTTTPDTATPATTTDGAAPVEAD